MDTETNFLHKLDESQNNFASKKAGANSFWSIEKKSE